MSFSTFLKTHGLTLLGGAGLLLTVGFTLTWGDPKAPPPNQLALPAEAPFDHKISGAGYVEGNTKNTDVSTFSNGIVDRILVKEGDYVKKGTPLFVLDEEVLKAELAQQQEAARVTKQKIAQAYVDLADYEDQLKRGKGLDKGFSITEQDYQKRRFNVARAKAQIAYDEASYAKALADIALTKVNLDQLTVKAPQDGIILKINIVKGEFVANSLNQPVPVKMGNTDPFHVRVQIDETDVWRFQKDMPAVAIHKSNGNLKYQLSFVRLEPYMQSKRDLRGDSAETVDTRVVEVVYRVVGEAKHLYVGQQLDVYIKTTTSS
ncbi:MAG: efflux RND transporter periplasmic adaptor subunit [Alphaproteobacteria bacterium]|jgi:HlyD family secretion protein|nr:biotin/lipoyl-binding protein [Alphaproteobacteria bacterium]